MVKKNYTEGSWFAVPLEPNGFAVGLAARNTPRGAGILAYFFTPRYTFPPDLSELSKLKPQDAIKVLQIGDLGLIKDKWKVIGKFSDWNRSDWPIPDFVRREPITNRVWLVKYSDRNPDQVVSEKLISENQAKNLETDSLYGYEAVEKVLSKLLK